MSKYQVWKIMFFSIFTDQKIFFQTGKLPNFSVLFQTPQESLKWYCCRTREDSNNLRGEVITQA